MVVFATRQWLLRAGKGQAAGRFLSFRSCKREIERVRARETERERERGLFPSTRQQPEDCAFSSSKQQSVT